MKFLTNLFRKKTPTASTQSHSIITHTNELLSQDHFWQIIHTTKTNSHNNFEQQQEELSKELQKLTPIQILQFENQFHHLKSQAYTWELWGAAYLIHGGCSDDTFSDFREWLIAQGQSFYTQTLQNPESLATIDPKFFEESDWEGFGYVATTVFEELTGQEMPFDPTDINDYTEPQGQKWSEDGDDLKNMFPKLFAKYFDLNETKQF